MYVFSWDAQHLARLSSCHKVRSINKLGRYVMVLGEATASRQDPLLSKSGHVASLESDEAEQNITTSQFHLECLGDDDMLDISL